VERLGGSRPWRNMGQTEVNLLVDAGFNTNYCQAWYMAHTDMRSPNPAIEGGSPKRRDNTLGPLRVDRIGPGVIASRVPLIGDGTIQLGSDDIDPVIINGRQVGGAKALTDGPAGLAQPPNGRQVWGRQSYEDFGPVHGKSGSIPGDEAGHNRYYGQMCFVDGSVRAFADDGDRDGRFGHHPEFLENGWGVPVYDELEGKVYGGWLSHTGLNF